MVPPAVPGPTAEAIARFAVDAAANKKAEDIVLLDIRELTSMADYFVICSASSDRQLKSVVEGIEQDLKGEGVRPVHVEGDQGSGWVLVDFGDVICHVFKEQERDYYRLEDLWTGARTLVRMQ
ncbi:MAG: ribosome silencing factor [Chloroflexi bacterium]|nr:ribosome silencing factor [Chloroflexota bacterium]